MISLRMLFGSKAPVPAMLAVVLVMSACVGQPPRLEEPSQVTISTLNRINSHPCTPTVASALDAYRVPSESIRDFFYTQRLSGESRLLGYTAWMHLTDQPGYLVVDVDRSCQFEQAYTRGGANLPGVYRALFYRRQPVLTKTTTRRANKARRFLRPELSSQPAGSGGDGRHCTCAAWSGGSIRKGHTSYPPRATLAATASLHHL
jgi:hypothetical protein